MPIFQYYIQQATKFCGHCINRIKGVNCSYIRPFSKCESNSMEAPRPIIYNYYVGMILKTLEDYHKHTNIMHAEMNFGSTSAKGSPSNIILKTKSNVDSVFNSVDANSCTVYDALLLEADGVAGRLCSNLLPTYRHGVHFHFLPLWHYWVQALIPFKPNGI